MASNKLSLVVRSFSTSSKANQLVKPPVQVFGMNGRYATALYSAATKQNALEVVEKDVLKFQRTMKTDSKLREFLINPTVKRSLKSEALKAVATKMSLSPQTSNLLQCMADNGRLKSVVGVINAFKTIMAAHRGEVMCEVITAKELDAGQKQKLESVLKSFVKAKESISITTKVDPNIIGGLIVSVGDRYVDMSVASKIKKYTDIISVPV